MAYVEAVLIKSGKAYEFSIEATDIRIMMKDILEIVMEFISTSGYPFIVTSFRSNALNIERFNMFINNHINRQIAYELIGKDVKEVLFDLSDLIDIIVCYAPDDSEEEANNNKLFLQLLRPYSTSCLINIQPEYR